MSLLSRLTYPCRNPGQTRPRKKSLNSYIKRFLRLDRAKNPPFRTLRRRQTPPTRRKAEIIKKVKKTCGSQYNYIIFSLSYVIKSALKSSDCHLLIQQRFARDLRRFLFGAFFVASDARPVNSLVHADLYPESALVLGAGALDHAVFGIIVVKPLAVFL